MDAEREAKKQKTRGNGPATPHKQVKKKDVKSASSWRQPELDLCGVEVQHDVDAWEMMPAEFSRLTDLKNYSDCAFPSVPN